MPPVSWKTKLPMPAKRAKLKQDVLSQLSDWHWQPQQEQYCDWRLDGRQAGQWLRLKQFSNGTLYVESTDPQGLTAIQHLLGERPALAAPMAGSRVTTPHDGNLRLVGPYLGTDESGKGDYFGPLVVAGVLVTPDTAQALTAIGVMDCKKLSDAKVMALADQIVGAVGMEQVAFISLMPSVYNQAYDQFKAQKKNLNHLLARGHARVIEAIAAKSPSFASMATRQVVVDQFGNESLVKSALPTELRTTLTLTQLPRAEANIGVAAASVVARAKFLAGIAELSVQIGVDLPLGAGPQVNKTARSLMLAQGPEVLGQVAKLHFKTTQLL